MITKDILTTLSDYEIHQMLTHYLQLASDLDSYTPESKLIEKLKPDIQKLFSRIPESTSNSYGGGEYFQVPCKKVADKFYYYENGTVFDDGHYLFDLLPWISKDSRVVKLVNDSLLQIIKKKEETAETLAAKAIKETQSRFNGILNRRHFIFIKYQMCRYLNKKFHVPKKFKLKGKLFYENARILEKILTSSEVTASTFRALNNSFGYQDCVDLYSWISALFGYHTSTYSNLTEPSNIGINIAMATEAQLQQMLDLHDVVFRPDEEKSWITERLYQQKYYNVTLEPLKLNIVDKVEGYYWTGSITDIVRFAKIAEALYNKENVPEDLKDFLVIMGIVEKKGEDTIER